MGVSDDNPSSFGDHYGFGRHAMGWMDYSKMLARFPVVDKNAFNHI
jgi:hypothetical protein